MKLDFSEIFDMSQERKNIENIIINIPKNKIPELKSLIESGKITKDSTIYDFKELGLTPDQAKIVKKSLSGFSDPKFMVFGLDFVNEIDELKKMQEKNTSLVWTGPLVDTKAVYTIDTMLEMIRSAKYSITLVGYVIYDTAKPLFDELKKARKRGVKIQFIFDKAKKYRSAIEKMWNGTDIPEIFSYKPKEKSSVLHAKVLIIDDARILVTSANVTGSALNRNIEMGLYHSGKAAKDARKLFTSLIDDGYMVKV